MWFKISKLCILFAIVQSIEGKANFTLRTNVPPVGIVNGKVAEENQFPHQVAVVASYNDGALSTFCGGSLISTTVVLTAGQCVRFTLGKTFNAEKVEIHLGSISLPSKNVVTVTDTDKIKVHPDFDMTKGTADLALIVLPSEVTTSKSVKPITVDYSSKDHAKEAATMAGWGRTKTDGKVEATLRYVDLKVISNDECVKTFSFVKDSHICTAAANDKNEHVGICGGDGGGALVSADGKQIGIASFLGQTCEDASYPSGYTRVSKYEDWIKENSSYQIVASKILLSLVSFVILLRNLF